MSRTPRTDREEYTVTAREVGFKAVNSALCRILEEQVTQVIEYGKKVAVWITGDPSDAAEVTDFERAMAAIKYAQQLGMQRNDALQNLKPKYEQLIMAVSNKYPEETRHQTALRYIQEREGYHRVYKEGEAKADQAQTPAQDSGKTGA